MKEMKHENLVQFFGVCIEPPNVCLVMQYCRKGSLKVEVTRQLEPPALELYLDCWYFLMLSSGCSKGLGCRAGRDIQALVCLRHCQRESASASTSPRFLQTKQSQPLCLRLREWTSSTKAISSFTGTWSPASVLWIVDFRSNFLGLDWPNLNTAAEIRQTWWKTPIIVVSDVRRNYTELYPLKTSTHSVV